MLPEIGHGRRARMTLHTAAFRGLRIQPLPSATPLEGMLPTVAVPWRHSSSCHFFSSSHVVAGAADSECLFPLRWGLAAAFDLAAGR
jgi:hypothetical protein